jgi:myo-inositol 2-dehydrogenase/D-chiro-inositol 1-dehydrogenase
VEQTTHICDLSRLFAGEVDVVYGALALRALTDVEGLDVPDVGAVVLRYESGAIGTVQNTCMLSQGYTVGIHIVARDLVVQQTGGLLKIITPDTVHEQHPKVNPTMAINETFVEAVRTGDTSKIKSPYSEGVKTLAISLAAVKSDETGEPVRIADL